MNRLVLLLVVGMAAVALLVSATPTLVLLMHAALPLVVAVGVVAIVARIAWWLSSRF